MSQPTPPEQPPAEVEINFHFVQKSLAKIIKEAPRKFKQVKDEAQKVQGNFKNTNRPNLSFLWRIYGTLIFCKRAIIFVAIIGPNL
jgi:predicted DNA-binding ArsR family transcriptional regulator